MTTMTALDTTSKIDNWDIQQVRDFLNLNPKDFKLLLQAYRRKNLLDETPKSIDSKFLGLGFPHEYKSKFFVVSGKETARINNWYSLSISGKEIMKEVEKLLPVPKNDTAKNKLNRLLYTF